MKKHISVFMLFIKSILSRLVVILAALAAAEAACFYIFRIHTLQHLNQTRTASLPFILVFLAAYAALAFALVMTPGRSSQYRYTTQRLSVSERAVFVWRCVSNVLAFILLWLWQILVLFALLRLYESGEAYVEGKLGVFIELNRVHFYHSVFPLQEIMLWVRNFVYTISAGAACALCSQQLSCGERPTIALIAIVIPIVGFGGRLASGNGGGAFFTFISAIIAAFLLYAGVRRSHSGKAGAGIENA